MAPSICCADLVVLTWASGLYERLFWDLLVIVLDEEETADELRDFST